MGFSIRHIISNPFWLVSIGICLAGWIIAVISTALSGATSFGIWEVVFMVVPILATIFAVGTDTIGAYRLALMPFYVIGIVYATSSAGDTLQGTQTTNVMLSVGLLVVAVTFFMWIIVAGVDRFLAGTGLSAGGGGGFSVSKRQVGAMYSIPQMSTRSVSSQQAITSVSVTATPQIAAVGQAPSSAAAERPSSAGAAIAAAGSANRPTTSESQASDGKPKEADASGATKITGIHVDVAPDVVYEYKAQAMYSYTASVDDPNELSFAKGEFMEIVDNQGKWWQARKADGSIGIVPSNYMKLMQ